MKLDYSVKYYDDYGSGERRGSVELQPGVNRVVLDLPQGRLREVKAHLRRRGSDWEKIFMNGFQSWTYCPEYSRWNRIRDLRHLPKFLVDRYGLDRYGDYYFVRYPNFPGHTHGESWCYFRNAETYELYASLDERPGYTVFHYDAYRGELEIERDCQGVHCGGEFHAFDLYAATGTEQEVFDGWFGAMGVKPRTAERLTGYSSWYNRYQAISEKSILEDLAGCAEVLKPGDLFQIDDGFEAFVGDWLEPDAKKFPHGMKPLVEQIHAKGLKAGLWLAPFVAQKGSRLLAEHPDWLLCDAKGKPWSLGSNWGGFYSLDIDHPGVIDYLERVFARVFDDWGFDLVKLDFLYGAAPLCNAKESRGGRMTRAMEWLRRLCGDKLILGCGVPLMPAFGLVDYCRISCDVGLDWNDRPIMHEIHRERVSTRQAIGNSLFRRQLNGRAWLNDPDVFFLREDNIKLTKDEKLTLATINSLFGGMLLCSDNMAQYTPEARAIYEQMLRNRDAEDVRVHNEHGLSVSYRLDGKEYKVEIKR